MGNKGVVLGKCTVAELYRTNRNKFVLKNTFNTVSRAYCLVLTQSRPRVIGKISRLVVFIGNVVVDVVTVGFHRAQICFY